MTRAALTEMDLRSQGWEYDHQANVKGYMPAGLIGEMQPRDGYEYCRVYTSETKHCGQYQITRVYRRDVCA